MWDIDKLNELYNKKLLKTNKLKPLPDKIFEPIPVDEHLFCTLCKI